MKATFSILALILIAAGGSAAAFGEFASDDPGLAERPGVFSGRFLALSDADMAATAYADGRLEPFAGAADAVTLFEDGRPVAMAAASNSVVSWPQVIDVSPDGRYAYIAETRGALAAGTEKVESAYTDFPQGRRLAVLAIGDGTLTQAAVIENAGVNLKSVEAARSGRFLAIASDEDGAELVIAPLDNGLPAGAPQTFDLSPPIAAEDAEQGARSAHLSPDGLTLAVNVANRRVQFYRLTLDETALPLAVTAFGAPTPSFGQRLSVGKWTPDGRYFIITDTGWPDSSIAMLLSPPGTLTVIAPPKDDKAEPRMVGAAKVGRGAEGFSLSRDGRFAASINMERTFLPQLAPLAFWPGRRLYSVSLLSLDPETGALTEIDRIRQAGVLPEDVIFDETGENLAVAVFHRRKGADRQRGFVDFFAIRDGKLESQGATQAVMRGAHDLVAIP